MRAALYLRFSQPNEREQQLFNLQTYAQENGFMDYEIFEDQTSSDNRSGQEEMLNELTSGRFNVLLVLQIDRLDQFARTVEDVLLLVARLAKHQIRLISVKDGIDSHSSGDEFTVNVLKAISLAKSTIKAERVSRALKLAHASGNFIGRPKTTDDELIHRLRKQGLSLRQIAAQTGSSLWAVQRSLKNKDKGLEFSL